jgi:hypothetical protein
MVFAINTAPGTHRDATGGKAFIFNNAYRAARAAADPENVFAAHNTFPGYC